MSNKPWYYVKGHGHRELIEKLIADKREKEAQNAEAKRKNHEYFGRWQQQNEWIAKNVGHECEETEGNLISEKRGQLSAPFDLDYDPNINQKKVCKTQEKIGKAKEELRKKLEKFVELERYSKKLERSESFFLGRIQDLQAIKKELEEKQENWAIRERKLYYNRFARDKLRLKAFLICERLNHYKITIEFLSKSMANIYLDKNEKEQLDEMIDIALNIINMYLDVNSKRNHEVIPLFNEEAEKRWLDQKSQWERERQVWYSLIDGIIDAFSTIYRCKLEDNLEKQESLLEKRAEFLKSLSHFIEKIRKDEDLASLPDKDVSKFFDSKAF